MLAISFMKEILVARKALEGETKVSLLKKYYDDVLVDVSGT